MSLQFLFFLFAFVLSLSLHIKGNTSIYIYCKGLVFFLSESPPSPPREFFFFFFFAFVCFWKGKRTVFLHVVVPKYWEKQSVSRFGVSFKTFLYFLKYL